MKKKTLGIIIVSVLGAAAIFCSAMFTHQYLDAKNSKATFDDLTNLITEIDEPQKDAGTEEESGLSAEELAAAEAVLAREKYTALFAQNNDFIGWIKIEGLGYSQQTKISGVYGQRLCLLFSQIPVFSVPTPLFLSAEICAIL